MEKTRYQCIYTGKLYDSEEEALKDPKCIGPLQPFVQGKTGYAKRGFFGPKVW